MCVVRVNTLNGLQEWRRLPLECWSTHPDPSVDIAVLKIGIDPQLCFAGLFWPHTGNKRNIPIVRIGNIAALRNEPVVNSSGLLMDAYLVESRSIGGLSGSPVFINIITAKRILPPSAGYMAGAYDPQSTGRFKLFGVVHGHFGDDLEPDAIVNDGKEKLHVNMGIAIITPAEKIIEVLHQFTKEEELEIAEARDKKLSLSVGSLQPTANVTFGTLSNTTIRSTG
jgi:hypothetical protein